MDIRHINKVFYFAVIAMLVIAPEAEAADAKKLSTMLDNVRDAFKNAPDILSVILYLLGLLFAVSGIHKFKEHVDNPVQHRISDGVKRFLAGGASLAAPSIITAMKTSLITGKGPGLSRSEEIVKVTSGTGMDDMIVKFVTEMYTPTAKLLTAFTYLAAIIFVVVGIIRLTKTAQEGPRGPGGLGTILTFLVSGALFSFGDMMGTFSTSLFGNADVKTGITISPNIIKADAATHIIPVVQSLMAFVMLVGFIAFIRGWFVLKAFGDGNQQATLAQALTLLFGGAVAINMGELVNILQETVGIGGITFT